MNSTQTLESPLAIMEVRASRSLRNKKIGTKTTEQRAAAHSTHRAIPRASSSVMEPTSRTLWPICIRVPGLTRAMMSSAMKMGTAHSVRSMKSQETSPLNRSMRPLLVPFDFVPNAPHHL